MKTTNEEHRLQILEQVKLSSQRLLRMRTGASLSQTLEKQGSETKRRFVDSYRIGKGVEDSFDCASRRISLQKAQSSELSSGPQDVLNFFANSGIDYEFLKENKTAFRLFPELEEQIFKTGITAELKDGCELLSVGKCQSSFQKSKSVPRLRNTPAKEVEQIQNGEELDKEIMNRIYEEEHQIAMEKLTNLQKQHRLQDINELEEWKQNNKKSGKIVLKKSSTTGMIIKDSFRQKSTSPLRSSSYTDKDGSQVEKIAYKSFSKRSGSQSSLRFRRGLTPDNLYPDLRKLSQKFSIHKINYLPEVSAEAKHPRVAKQVPSEKKQPLRLQDMYKATTKMQIKLIPKIIPNNNAAHAKEKDIVYVPENNKPKIVVLTSRKSFEYPKKVFQEVHQFLENERDIIQQGAKLAQKDEYLEPGKKIETKGSANKWPLASNTHSLENSVQGSENIERIDRHLRCEESRSSVGDTSYLIKKYQQSRSEHNDKNLISISKDNCFKKPDTGDKQSNLEKSFHENYFISSEFLSSSKIIGEDSSKMLLPPKIQRSMSNV